MHYSACVQACVHMYVCNTFQLKNDFFSTPKKKIHTGTKSIKFYFNQEYKIHVTYRSWNCHFEKDGWVTPEQKPSVLKRQHTLHPQNGLQRAAAWNIHITAEQGEPWQYLRSYRGVRAEMTEKDRQVHFTNRNYQKYKLV